MFFSPALIFRWLAWLLLVTLESVIGFPWLSIYFAGEWVFGYSSAAALISLVVMTLVLSAAYSLPLSIAAVALVLIWQALLRTRKNTWPRWAVYWGITVAIGIFHQLPVSALTVSSSIISFLIFFKLSGGKVLQQPWQTKKLARLSE